MFRKMELIFGIGAVVFCQAIAIAASDPDFNPFLADMKHKIRAAWASESVCNQISPSRETVVKLWVNREGLLVGTPKIGKSSGSIAFDQTTLDAVKRAPRLNPLPKGYAKDKLDVDFTFKCGD